MSTGSPVVVNVYNMSRINEYTSNIGIGVYHTGVVVHGVEYAYGGHQFPISGVFDIQPRDTEELGERFKFKECLHMGYTDLPPVQIDQILEQMGEDFRGDQYHLLRKNCNHFTATVVEVLTGKALPKWVNRLASMTMCIPLLEKALPQEWITPMALQQNVNEHQDRMDHPRSD